AVRAGVLDTRRSIVAESASRPSDREAAAAQIESRALAWLQRRASPSLHRVFNLTGTVLHTNLGRAPFADAAVDSIQSATGACDVEYDLETGRRGNRDERVSVLLREITGAQ